jgi:hypothetical protein
MKSILYIIILSVIAPLFIACSEDLNLCAQQNTVVETDYSCDDVILQERNPSLPDVITGQPSFDEELTRSGEMIGGTDKIIIYNIDFIIFSYCRLLLDKLFIYSSKGIVTISSGFAFDVVFIIPYQEPLNLTSLSLASFPLR